MTSLSLELKSFLSGQNHSEWPPVVAPWSSLDTISLHILQKVLISPKFSITFQTFHYTFPPLVIENSDILYLFVSHAQEYLYVVVGSIWLFLHDRVSFSWKTDIKVETRRQGGKEARRQGDRETRRQGGDVTHQSLRTPAWGGARWPLQRHWLYTVRLRSE